MALEISGRLFKVLSEQTGTGRAGTWIKQDFVLETTDQYPKKVCFSVWGDKVNDLKSLSPGDEIKVSFDVQSREYNDKWFSDIRAWRIEKLSNQGQGSMAPPPFPELPSIDELPGAPDDLPFKSAR